PGTELSSVKDGPEPLLAEEGDPLAGSDLRDVLQYRLEVAVPRIPDDADLHRASRLSSCCSAVIRRAIPPAVSPKVSSWSARGACSTSRSGTPRATTRVSG